jgi:predicted ArsR family transcriptional regulator
MNEQPHRLPRQDQARALGDPTRHALYRYLVAAGRDVDVAELTTHASINHNAVRQHLAKLVAAGLVVEEREHRHRPGRPRLLYRAAAEEVASEEGYERLAGWLTEVVAGGGTPHEVGRRAGERLASPLVGAAGDAVARMSTLLEAHGFAPATRHREGETHLVLGRCPYAHAVMHGPQVVCDLHLGLAEGAASVIGGLTVEALVSRDPRDAGCRLVVREEQPPVPPPADP